MDGMDDDDAERAICLTSIYRKRRQPVKVRVLAGPWPKALRTVSVLMELPRILGQPWKK